MCGILGLLLSNPAAHAATEICEGLSLLQHRGQDACGIVTCGRGGRFYQCKANGMVRDVFDPKSVETLMGGMGVGHGRLLSFGVLCSLLIARCMQSAIPPPAPQHMLKPNRSMSTLHME